MGFIDDIIKSFGEDFTYGKGFKCTLTDGAGYFENVAGIIEYTSDEIIISYKSGKITVNGSGLYIKKYCEGDIVVCGKITALKRD